MSRSAIREKSYDVWVKKQGKDRMLQYQAKDQQQAIHKAQKAGFRVIHVNKTRYDELLGNITKIVLPPDDLIKHSALALEEIAFRRAKRIENNKEKDKHDIDI